MFNHASNNIYSLHRNSLKSRETNPYRWISFTPLNPSTSISWGRGAVNNYWPTRKHVLSVPWWPLYQEVLYLKLDKFTCNIQEMNEVSVLHDGPSFAIKVSTGALSAEPTIFSSEKNAILYTSGLKSVTLCYYVHHPLRNSKEDREGGGPHTLRKQNSFASFMCYFSLHCLAVTVKFCTGPCTD
jgi:hypothetical protein